MAESEQQPRQAVPSVAVEKTYELDVKPAVDWATLNKSAKYPPIASIPRTSAARLSEPDARPALDPFPVEPIPASKLASPQPTDGGNGDGSTAAPTILYLAYGSNMAASVFLGRRGIRPLSRLNVSAPSLRLTFDIPGFPYAEPCFANSGPRKVPKVPPEIPEIPKIPPKVPDLPNPPKTTARGDPVWDKGMIGVVYEVTHDDFAKIMATEGGGTTYRDIMVPVVELAPNVSVPEHPPVPELPRPFLAHTLYAPLIRAGKGRDPGAQDDARADGGDDDLTPPPPELPKTLPRWLARLLVRLLQRPSRPDPDYAQASPRYMGLLRDGARENDLPPEYQAYLAALTPYRPTSTRQQVGRALYLSLAMCVVLVMFPLGRLFAKEKGGAPPLWVRIPMGLLFHGSWALYDRVFKPLFGDGERTEEHKERQGGLRWKQQAVDDEEKKGLLEKSE